MTRVLLVALVLLASACSVPAAPTADLPDGAKVLARFGDARALGMDGAMRLYVAEASEVVVLDTSGAVLHRLGGTDDQAFLDVADVDPTNGQAVFVADVGTGRIVRFTAEGRAVEEIEVPRLQGLGVPDRANDGLGRPIAVAAGPGNVVYAIEAERGVVLRWDADRTLDRVIGGPASPMPLRAPSALAVQDDGALLVADVDRIVAYDAFGAVQQVFPMPRVVAVTVFGGDAFAVLADGLRQLDRSESFRVELGEEIRDVAVVGLSVFVLTRTRLVQMPLQISE